MMAQRIWNSIRQGSYFDPQNWAGGIAPASGDTVLVNGSAGPAPTRFNGALGPELNGNGNPDGSNDIVYLYTNIPDVGADPAPSSVPVAPAVTDETITSYGGNSDNEFDLVNSTLSASTTLVVAGNTDFRDYYSNTLAGLVEILPTSALTANAAGYNGELDIRLAPNGSVDPASQSVRSYVPTTTNTGAMLVGAGSRLGIYLTGQPVIFTTFGGTTFATGGFDAFVNNGTIGVADGSFDVQGLFSSGAGRFNQFVNNGLIQIQGVNTGATGNFDAEVDGSGAIAVVGAGTARASVTFDGGVANAVTLTDGIAQFQALASSATYTYSGSLTFGDGNSALIIGSTVPTGAFLPINGLQTGDEIVVGSYVYGQPFFGGSAPATATVTWDQAAGQLTIGYTGLYGSQSGVVRTLQVSGVHQQSDFSVTSTPGSGTAGTPGYMEASATVTVAACYRRGTLILLERGEVAVEDVAVGDRVVTASGARRPVRWVARRAYAARFAARNPAVWPVVIRAGAFHEGTPRRDLHVSPRHAMFLDGVLIPADALVNGTTVVQDRPTGPVEYFHIELDSHDVLVAEGSLSESYVADDNRSLFQNAAQFRAEHPGAVDGPARYCAPRVEDGPALEEVRRRVAARAPGGREKRLPLSA